jgi:glycosyltransferase involved in cell wall biosynthesis
MPSLSVLIPACNEPHLQKTIDDVLKNSKGDTDVLVALDNWSNPPEITPNSRVRVISSSLGQRGATNALARLTDARFIMKLDAHCSMSGGFDIEMLKLMDDETILAPQMGVLDPISWTINGKKMTTRYCFDSNLVMQYDEENGEEETMCLQGSCWMVDRETYWKWNLGDDSMPSWGGQATELGIKAFLNGGRCLSTKETYYGHVFRHTDTDFPYDRGENPGKEAIDLLKKKYLNKDLIPLIRKFNLPADWTEEKLVQLK